MFASALVAGSSESLELLLSEAKRLIQPGGVIEVVQLSAGAPRGVDALRAAGFRVALTQAEADEVSALGAALERRRHELVVCACPRRQGLLGGVWRRLEREVLSRAPALLLVRGKLEGGTILFPRSRREGPTNVARVAELAKTLGGEVALLQVTPCPLNAGVLRAHPEVLDGAAGREGLEPARRHLDQAGVRTRCLTSSDEVTPGILGAAKREQASLIVLTDPDPTSLAHRVLGSRVGAVLRGASTSVLVFSPTAECADASVSQQEALSA